MTSPYDNLPDSAYWRTGVAERAPGDPGELYRPKFPIGRKAAIVTAGSCFAQHIGRHLRAAGCKVVDTEPGPPGVPAEVLNRFGFGLYSARYGNIYTARQLLQLYDEAMGEFTPAEPIWERGGRFFDAFRPNVEPEGLDSPDLVRLHRQDHLAAVRAAFLKADVFVFTFGLTEAWVHKETGTVYPTAPGTIAGDYDPARFAFVNYSFHDTITAFRDFRRKLMEARKAPMRFLITVSPVPLTATASGKHVEVASTYSKAVLRAVCGQLADTFPNVDYFPSFEVITSQQAGGRYYEANRRSVTKEGVAQAMNLFLSAHGLAKVKAAPVTAPPPPMIQDAAQDVICEEALLEAFRK